MSRNEDHYEQQAYLPGNGNQPPARRRRVSGYAPPIVLPDVHPFDRMTEEDEALAGYPDEAPEQTRSSVARGWMQAASSREMVPYQDVEMVNVFVRPRRSRQAQQRQPQQRPQRQQPQRVPRFPHQQEEEQEPTTTSDTLTPAARSHPRVSLLHRLPLSTPLALVLGMLAMLGLILLSATLLHVWQGWQDEWRYGYPRTYQTDAVVGHNHDSTAHASHFLAENLHGSIIIVEYPAGEVAHTLVYTGPALYGAEADQVPVTLTFRDVTGDGAPDMIIHAGTTTAIFVNDPTHNTFRPLRPGDHVSGL